MLDIQPETITVDKLIDQSIAQISKPKVPVIKFSRPTGNKKQNEEQEANAPSFRFRTKNRKSMKIFQCKKQHKFGLDLPGKRFVHNS